MKRLLVLRHAKAVPHDEKSDEQRRLIERGRSDAALMGRAMNERAYLPQVVLCSSAARTKETWEAAAPELGTHPEVEFLDALYDAPEAAILKCVQGANNSAATVLCIGHNPGLERFARMLIRKPENPRERRHAAALAEKFPTSALAVIDFNVRAWANIALGTGTLTDFISPADLKHK